MKRITIIIASVLIAAASQAQQQSLYSSFLLNGFVYNPALAGVEDHLDVRTSYRKQWLNVQGSPTTMYASIHGAVNQRDLNREELGSLPMRGSSSIKWKYDAPKKMRHGVGGFVMSDRAGLLLRNSISLGYSLHLPLGQKYYLAIGAAAMAHTFNLERPTLRDAGDDAFAGNLNFGTLPDAQAGVYLYSDRIQLGLSATQLTQSRMSFARNNKDVSFNNTSRHLYATGSYRIGLDSDFDLIPVGIIRYTANSPLSLEGGAKIRYSNTFWAGGTYRYGDAISGMVGFSLYKMLDFCYAFDFTTSRLQTNSTGTHEIVFGIRLNNKKSDSRLKVW
jgi:type IX secretion system PorP/SprF family membrane protein